ncbi:MAG: hypothetical protein KatS3mg040_1830 [Candidatus Kapaibacterium sp.]|nr:MAG: hypothetical protein KatS3mg040_1830 [Candidatus Kapabacteria bacterium]
MAKLQGGCYRAVISQRIITTSANFAMFEIQRERLETCRNRIEQLGRFL